MEGKTSREKEEAVLEAAVNNRTISIDRLKKLTGIDWPDVDTILTQHHIHPRKNSSGRIILPEEYLPPVYLVNRAGIDSARSSDSGIPGYEEQKQRILDAIVEDDALVTVKQISDVLGLSLDQVEEILILEDNLSVEIPRRRDEFVDDKIMEKHWKSYAELSRSLVKSGYRRFGTRESTRNYIRKTGQKELFEYRVGIAKARARREKAVEEKKTRFLKSQLKQKKKRQSIIDATSSLYNKSRNADWGYQKMVECVLAHPHMKRDPARIADFYRIYKHAKDSGETPTLKRMTEEAGLSYSAEGRLLLLAINEKHFRRNRKYRHLTLQDKKRIKKANALGISPGDITYFIGWSRSTIWKYCKGITPKKPIFIYHRKDNPIKAEHDLTLGIASFVYEAEDAGFNAGEIEQLLDVRPVVIDDALAKRATIEPIILKTLNILYPEKAYTKPYLPEPAAHPFPIGFH